MVPWHKPRSKQLISQNQHIACPCIGWAKKPKQLCLTACIFKMPAPICVILGRLQCCSVSNTSVKSVDSLSIQFTSKSPPPGKSQKPQFCFQRVFVMGPMAHPVHGHAMMGPIARGISESLECDLQQNSRHINQTGL